MQNAARFEIDSQRIATVLLDAPEKSVNTMSVQMWNDLDNAVATMERERPAGVVFCAAKPPKFLAGADQFYLRAQVDSAVD
jgi:enoyl-CoA hydratase/carnithine racemase